MKKVKLTNILCLMMTLVMVMSVLVGCGSKPAQNTPGGTESSSNKSGEDSDKKAGSFNGKVKIALISTLTGDNSLNGEFAQHGFEMAVQEINAKGGILGKEVVYSLGDEMSTTEGSVSALAKILDDDEVMAICGSHMSIYAVAGMNQIKKAGSPYVSNGSSSAVDKEKNPYVWQSRPLDIYQGVSLVKVAVDTLNIKNPAILYSTDSTYVSLKDKTIAAYKEKGIEIPEKNLFAFAETEKNFSNYISQIISGKFDGLIEISGQNPCILIMQQASAAGLNIPRIGYNAVGDTSTLKNAGATANGWYCIADWVPSVNTEKGKEFVENFNAKWNNSPATSAAYAYDAVYMIKAAMEAANTTTDREAINKGFEKVKDVVGAAGAYSYYTENHSLASSLFVSKVENGVAVCQETVKFR